MVEGLALYRLGVKQFRVGKRLSYVVFDPMERRAVILNPLVHLMDDYHGYLAQNRLALSWVFLAQADSENKHVLSYFPKEVQMDPVLGNPISVGSIQLLALQEQEICLYSEGVLFLNDLSLLQSPSSAPSAFFKSLKKLPPHTIVYPCFEELGLAFSILENEISGNTTPVSNQRLIEMGIEKYKNKLAEGDAESAFIDVREQSDFLRGHIPNTRNFPSSEIAFRWDELKVPKKIYVSCAGGDLSAQVVRTLNYLGLANVIHMKAGFRGWSAAGLPVERAPSNDLNS
jgi:rhodanese-related sulfurtransferase